MNDQELLQNGYRTVPGPFLNDANALFQKRFIDTSLQTKYFINIYKWDLKWASSNVNKPQYHAEVAMYDKSKNMWWKIELHGIDSETTIEEVENRFEKMWQKMKFKYDRHNN